MGIFDLDNIEVVEFGICKQSGENEQLFFIPTDINTKECLKEMLANSCIPFDCEGATIEHYDISQKYASSEILSLQLNNENASRILSIYNATDIESRANEMSNPENIIYYFCNFTDVNRNKLIAFRRATYFRALQKKTLLQFRTDTLQVVEDHVFKLDYDFDFMVAHSSIFIHRPSSFDFIAQIDNQSPEEVHARTLELGNRISFLNAATLAEYASTRKLAARYIASISSRSDLDKLSHDKVRVHCLACGINLCEENIDGFPKIWPAEKHEMQFLKMLDRRLLGLDIIDEPEYYEAANRKKLN